jgi:hypothetical protein
MKNGFLTFVFAFVPGAGQMYQGYMKRGLSLISLFCFSIMLAYVSNILLVFTPIIWMYSFFDTFNLRGQLEAGTAPADDYIFHLFEDDSLEVLMHKRHRLVGWILVAVGVYIGYDEFLMGPLNSLWWRHSHNELLELVYSFCKDLPVLVLCIALIAVGAWLVRGPKPSTDGSKLIGEDIHYYEQEPESDTQDERNDMKDDVQDEEEGKQNGE